MLSINRFVANSIAGSQKRFVHYVGLLNAVSIVAQAFPRLSVGDIKRLPIAAVDMKNLVEKPRHDKLVGLVDKMLTLTPKLHGTTSESEKTTLQNAITTTDAEIDRLVYMLYGLNDEEIKIIEKAT